MNWINDFTDKLFSLDIENSDIEGAYLLKHGKLPSSVFKYREINENSIKNLEEDTIWLADPSKFNDPYDCAHTVDYDSLTKYNESDILKYFLNSHGKNLKLDDEAKSSLIQEVSPLDALVELIIKDEPQDKKDTLRSLLKSAQQKINEDLATQSSNHLLNSFKLCSFSEINNSILMWAHYAGYHQGFCIEYDIESIPYSDHRRRFLYPTIYSDFMFDATNHLKKDIHDPSFNCLYLSKAALHKASDWKYEKEWRLIFSGGIIEKEQSYVMGKPKAVYLGTKISSSNQNKLVDICNNKSIPIYKMKTHRNKFLLEATNLKDADQFFFK